MNEYEYINVELEEDVYNGLVEMAKQQGKDVDTFASEILEQAIKDGSFYDIVKKNYTKPEMNVINVDNKINLLAGSFLNPGQMNACEHGSQAPFCDDD